MKKNVLKFIITITISLFINSCDNHSDAAKAINSDTLKIEKQKEVDTFTSAKKAMVDLKKNEREGQKKEDTIGAAKKTKADLKKVSGEKNKIIPKKMTDITSADTLSSINKNASTNEFCGCSSIKEVLACQKCFEQSNAVLRTGYKISFIDKKLFNGSCWDFVNDVYVRSGSGKEQVFSSKKAGPYADCSILRAGDWIYHINYSYGGVEHSAIFVCWKDKEEKIAITLSYVGQNRLKPGRLGESNLKGIYNVIRPVDKK